jgi:hypothetical protein
MSPVGLQMQVMKTTSIVLLGKLAHASKLACKGKAG